MKRLFYLFLTALITSCQSQVEINNITNPPIIVDADKSLANVYAPLDGIWKGVFLVKESSPINKPDNLKDKNVMLNFINSATTINTIHVTQVYTSETPYFQRVSITDFYPDTGKTEKSVGVNKVQDGAMWCVVHKPNDVVIHSGSAPDTETIIWQSEQQSPLKEEYFYETVTKSNYEIIGYGYYGNDDTSLSPKFWFYGKYERQ